MCGGGKAPEPVRTDPVADADKIAAQAAVAANADAQGRRKSRRASSLLASAGPAAAPSSVMSYGKATLGG